MSQPGVRWTRQLAAAAMFLLLSCRATTAPEEEVITTKAPEEQVITLDIASATVPCMGPFPQQCMQVRSSADAPWNYFYSVIEGFQYEAGYLYTVRVAVRVIANPPLDASSHAYRLLALVSKTPG